MGEWTLEARLMAMEIALEALVDEVGDLRERLAAHEGAPATQDAQEIDAA